jgi:hypothetical protein
MQLGNVLTTKGSTTMLMITKTKSQNNKIIGSGDRNNRLCIYFLSLV